MEEITNQEKKKILKNVGVFRDIDEDILQEIAQSLEVIRLKRQQNVFKKGDHGDAMYIIAEGEVRIHDGNHVLSKLEQNNVFGEYSLIDDETRSASVTAEKPSVILRLKRKDFDNLISQQLGITKGILKVLIQRMRYMNVLEEKLAKSYIKIRKQNQEISLQNESINTQKLKLEEQNFDLLNINEEKNHLISVVVHGLKNPLTSSLCMVDLLAGGSNDLKEEQREYAEIIKSSLGRMNKMINEILDVNVIDSKVLQLKFDRINIGDIAKNIICNHRLTFEQRVTDFEEDISEVFANLNDVYISQIIDNLVSNAIKFTPVGESISLAVKKIGDKAQIIIRDNGIGISTDKIDVIFDMYSRKKDHLKQDELLPGLGLAIVKKYVTAMNGKVWCESKEGEGASFFVEFDAVD